LIAFICAVAFPDQSYNGIGFTTFVGVSGLIIATAFFVIHIVNVVPDNQLTILNIIVSRLTTPRKNYSQHIN